MMRAKPRPWRQDEVAAAKAAAKAELDAVLDDLDARLRAAMRRVDEAHDDESPEGRLRCYVFAMSALVHHERHAGLTPAQVKGLADVALGVLRVQGVQPTKSRLAFLHSELHLVLSQIARKSGRHWHALWEQQLAAYTGGATAEGGAGLMALAEANRALRIGLGAHALRRFADAEELAANQAHREKARLGRIKTLRLTGDRDAALALQAQTAAGGFELSDGGRKELAWERACVGLDMRSNLAPMIAAVSKRGEHHEAIYLLEAVLWSYASASTEWSDKLPAMDTIGRYTDMKPVAPRETGFLFECCTVLDRCYDTVIPFAMRLDALGRTLERLDELVSIEKELLAWVAAARWLARGHAFGLAQLALRRYGQLSLALSEGASVDVLRLTDDLRAAAWFAPAAAS